MSFLQPWLLAGLPLIVLPIIIHLINQRRFQTIQWAAMMFLLAAHKMARGYSRLRQLLIMLFRMLAVAGLLFAVARPLASGWIGLAAGGKPDTTIILLDRSPSMQQRGAGTGESKLETGKKQLMAALGMLGSGRYVLIDSITQTPQEIESPQSLSDLANAGATSAPADLPGMLQAAHDYVRDNRAGRTEIWMCSDLAGNDWSADSGRWSSLREAFLAFPQSVRFHLLAYPQPANDVAIRVTDAKRQLTTNGPELYVSLKLTRRGNTTDKVSLPVQFDIQGARSSVTVELVGEETELRDHRIPLDVKRERGWGRVSIPADANPANDDFFFVFDNPPPRKTIVVAEDPQVERPLQLAASISPEAAIVSTAEVLGVDQLSTVDFDQTALVFWQAALPTDDVSERLQKYVDRGGQIVFLPPRNPGSEEFLGMKWGPWQSRDEPWSVETWRGDEDLLSRTLSGAALPVGQLQVFSYCQLTGNATPLATLLGGAPLVSRVPTKRGGVYFWTTTPAIRDSSLATNGVVLYAFVQRALAVGAEVLARARQFDAGPPAADLPETWNRLTESTEGLSTEPTYHRGVYAAEDFLLAVNRPEPEDRASSLEAPRVDELFAGLNFVRVDDQAGNVNSLIQEIWRVFLMAMLIALIAEAALCLPKVARPAVGAPA